MILALLGAAGGWTTLAVGGAFAWVSSIYTYNRDAWMTDVQLRQQFEYQCDNMQVAAHQMSRDEVRDRSQAAITKLSNYILVTTLIVALAAEILVEGHIPVESADFILNAYMLCLGTSVLYLVLSILFGIVAINQIYDSAAYLLTDKIPPAWQDIDSNMLKKMTENHVDQFESKSWSLMFMPPLLRRIFPGKAKQAGELTRTLTEERIRCDSGQEEASGSLDMPATVNPASSSRRQPQLQGVKINYSAEFRARERIWIPLTSQSFECLALGVKNLLDVYGYLCLARLYSEFGGDWAFWAVQIVFASLNVLIMMFLFDRINPCWYFIPVASGPLFCAIAATTPYSLLDRFCVPLCYLSHFVLCFFFNTKVHDGGYCALHPPEEQEVTLEVPGKIEDIGVEVEPETGKIKKVNKEKFNHHKYYASLDDNWRIVRIGDRTYDADLLKQKESSARPYLCTFCKDDIEFAVPEKVVYAQASSLRNDYEGYEPMQPESSEGCEMSHRPTDRAMTSTRASSAIDHDSKDDSGFAKLHSLELGFAQGGDQHACFSSCGKGIDSAAEAVSGDRSPRGESDVIKRKARHTRKKMNTMMRIASTVVQSLWFMSVMWALNKSSLGSGYKNSAAYMTLSGPPLAHVTLKKTKWPSPYFAPHAVACPKTVFNVIVPCHPAKRAEKHLNLSIDLGKTKKNKVCVKASQAFLADDFRVYSLGADNTAHELPCDVNGTIADISADCNEHECWPLVLLKEAPPRIVACSTGKEYPLLQTTRPSEQFAVVNNFRILAAHQGQIVEYHWCHRRHGWAPSWIIADVGEGALQALDVVGDRMLAFRRQGRHMEEGVVQVQNLNTSKQCGVWTMPPAIVGAGCGVHAGKTLKLLVRLDKEGRGPAVRLMEAELKELEESAQTCDEEPEDEDVPRSFRGSRGHKEEIIIRERGGESGDEEGMGEEEEVTYDDEEGENNRWLD